MDNNPRVEVIGERKVNWWLIAGGIVLILLACSMFVAPFLFLEFIVVWAGVGVLFSGVMSIVSYAKTRMLPGAGWSLFMGVLDIIIGVFMLMHPFVLAPVLPWLLGVLFIAFGVLEAIGTKPYSAFIPESRVIMVISGILTAIVGIMFIIWPTSLSIWVAAFVLIRGVTMLVGGFTARIE